MTEEEKKQFKKEFMQRWNQKIKDLMLEHKLSKKEMAKLLEVSISTFNNWAKNKSSPRFNHIICFCIKFNLSTHEFFGEPSPEIIENTIRIAKRIRERELERQQANKKA